ncbi:MAG: SGNH/GDSL hydrolase family protein [Ardenticatenales bacterium]
MDDGTGGAASAEGRPPSPPSASPPLAFRVTAVGCGVVAAVLLGLGGARLAGIDLGLGVRNARRVIEPLPTPAPSGYMTADPIRGFRHVPNTSAAADAEDFHVTYTIDALGARDMPAHHGAPSDRRVVEVFGDSFTFGHGMPDDTPYPAVLQRDLWPAYEVRNRGVNGYGTMQSMAWLDQLAPEESRLAIVLCGWLPFHLSRNGPDPSWLAMVDSSHQRLPFYRVVDGLPVFERLIGPADALAASDPALVEIEWANTEAAIRQMNRTARGLDAKFRVVLLPFQHPEAAAPSVARMRQMLAAAKITAIDLAEMDGMGDSDLYLPHDGHPKAEWHRRVAVAIATAMPYRTVTPTPTPTPTSASAR